MRSTILAICFTVLALPAAAQETTSGFELVGFTSTTHTGDMGVLGATLACQAEYTDSRMCNSVEVMQTVNVPSGLAGAGWVRPVFVPTVGTYSLDASGARGSADSLTCDGWTANGAGAGLHANDSGGIYPVSCAIPIAIACCADSSPFAAAVPINSPMGQILVVMLLVSGLAMHLTTRRKAAVEQ